MSMPVTMNEPLSALQRLCEELQYAELLNTANELEDPYDRMVQVAAFAVSAYSGTQHRAGSKPFNPILGETYECVREDKGFKFVAEQVCTKYSMLGAGRLSRQTSDNVVSLLLVLFVECVVLPLMGVVLPLVGVVLPFVGVVLPLESVVLPLVDVVLPFEGVVLPLEGVVLPLVGVLLPLVGVVLLFVGVVLPFVGVVSPFVGVVLPLEVYCCSPSHPSSPSSIPSG